MRHARNALFAALVLASGCGSTSAESEDTPANAPSSTPPPKDEPKAPPAPSGEPDAFVSLIAEAKPGEAPARIGFENATTGIVSMWLGELWIPQVPKGMTGEPGVAASLDVLKDTLVGFHEELDGPCAQVSLTSFVGPSVLLPGASYTLRLTERAGAKGREFDGALAAAPDVPFVALRTEVHDGVRGAAASARLTVDVGGQPIVLEASHSTRTGYLHRADVVREATKMELAIGEGRNLSWVGSIKLDSAPGYTLIVDTKPIEGAAAVATLAPRR